VITAEGFPDRSWKGRVEEIPDSVTLRRLKPQDPSRPTDTRILAVKVAFAEPTPLRLGTTVELRTDPAAGRGGRPWARPAPRRPAEASHGPAPRRVARAVGRLPVAPDQGLDRAAGRTRARRAFRCPRPRAQSRPHVDRARELLRPPGRPVVPDRPHLLRAGEPPVLRGPAPSRAARRAARRAPRARLRPPLPRPLRPHGRRDAPRDRRARRPLR